MDLELEGKGFLVLGATRGLGRAVAEQLAAEGARVLIASRTAEKAGLAEAIGHGVRTLDLDVAQPDVERVTTAVRTRLGGLDGVLINSGGPPPGPALALSDDDWLHGFRLLVGGPMALLRGLVPLLGAPASVLWITSSSVRQPIPGLDVSNLLRPGIAALVKSLARELGPDVRVNSLAPGRFDTARVRELDDGRAGAQGIGVDEVRRQAAALIPIGRYGDASELARVAAFLLSPAASYVNGASVQVDGGMVTAVP